MTLGMWTHLPALVASMGIGGVIAGGLGLNYVDKLFSRAERAARHVMSGSAATITSRLPVSVGDRGRELLVVRRGHLAESTLSVDDACMLALDLRHDGGRVRLHGDNARRAATSLSPALNLGGASDAHLRDAVQSIVVRGGSEQYLATIGRWVGTTTRAMSQAPRQWTPESVVPDTGLYALTPTQRLALEIALHENAERRALDGELLELETAWRDAEEIAVIADSLGLPKSVEDEWTRLRARISPS